MKFFGFELLFRRAEPQIAESRAVVAAEPETVAAEPELEQRSMTINSPEFIEAILGGVEVAGVRVNSETALGVTAFFAAVRLIAGALAIMDFGVFRKVGGFFEEIHEHPVLDLLTGRVHPYATRFEFFQALVGNAILGNALAKIHRDALTNRPVFLEIIPHGNFGIMLDGNGVLSYHVSYFDGRGSEVLYPHDVIHLKGLTLNGLAGKDLTVTNRNTFAAGVASDDYVSNYFENKATPGGIMTYNGALPEDDKQKIESKINKKHAGTKNSGKIMVLDMTQSFHVVQNNLVESALVEFKNSVVDDISRISGVPSHLLSNLSRSTNSNIYQQSTELVLYCLDVWAANLSEELTTKLFRYDEIYHEKLSLRLDTSHFLVGDSASEAEFVANSIQNAVRTPNELRKRYKLPPLPGGDRLLIQLNMIPLEHLGLPPAETPPASS